MCMFGGTGGTAPKSDPVSVTVPTVAGSTSKVNDNAVGNNTLTKVDDNAVGDNTLIKGAVNNGVTPAEELNQSAPRRKTENTTQANALAIGTKRYRTSKSVGLGTGGGAPSTGLAGVR